MKLKLACLPALLFLLFVLACNRQETLLSNCDKSWIDKANEKWGVKSDCGDLYESLFKGIYNGSPVYYLYPDGPGLISASVAPLEYVVNCEGDSIKINPSLGIKEVKILAKSCR